MAAPTPGASWDRSGLVGMQLRLGVSRLSPLTCPLRGLLGREDSQVDSRRNDGLVVEEWPGARRRGPSGRRCLLVRLLGVVAAV